MNKEETQFMNKDDVLKISNGLLVLRLCRYSLKPKLPFQRLGWPRRPFERLNRPDSNVWLAHDEACAEKELGKL